MQPWTSENLCSASPCWFDEELHLLSGRQFSLSFSCLSRPPLVVFIPTVKTLLSEISPKKHGGWNCLCIWSVEMVVFTTFRSPHVQLYQPVSIWLSPWKWSSIIILTPTHRGAEGTLIIIKKKKSDVFNSAVILSSSWLSDPLATGVSYYFFPPFSLEYIITALFLPCQQGVLHRVNNLVI